MKQMRTAIFIHGAGGGGWEWAIWQRVFIARGWRVSAPDLLPIDGGIAATRFEDYAAQVQDWCQTVVGPTVLIGASFGGLLALDVSARLCADALVLINPLPPAGVGPPIARIQYADIVPWCRERSLASTRRAMPDADDAACLFALYRWRDESGAVLRAAAAGIHVEITASPVLVLASERDADVQPATSRQLAERIGAELRIVRGASHVGPLLGRAANTLADTVAVWCSEVIRGEPAR